MTTDTPETDAVAYKSQWEGETIPPEFARGLERQISYLQAIIGEASEPIDCFELRPKGVMLKSIVRFEGETSWCKASEVSKRMEILRSAICVPAPRSRWHPIANAPRDRRILIFFDGEWMTAEWDDTYWLVPGPQNSKISPTHWMPLPQSPTA